MTPDLLMEISKNPKLQNAFSNPEYMYMNVNMIYQILGNYLNANNPKEVMQRYRNNPEFMIIL